MFRGNWGRLLLTFLILSSTIVSVFVDWNATHIFNSQWPGHARFHDVELLNLLCGVSLLSLWLMWRQSKEPEIGVRVAAIIVIIYRIAFFYIGWLVPGTSLLPGDAAPPRIAGIPIFLNVVASGVYLVLTVFAYWLYRREQPIAPKP